MTSLNVGALSAINVGVINDKGALETTITLEEFFRVAKSSTFTSTAMRHAENWTLISLYQEAMTSLPK